MDLIADRLSVDLGSRRVLYDVYATIRRGRVTVILGPNGLVEGARPGTVIVDASTVSPAHSIAMRDALQPKGIHYLDAPCTGSKPGAEGGKIFYISITQPFIAADTAV